MIINSLQVVDAQLGVTTPNGMFWHRYNKDGYGETSTGAPWFLTSPDTLATHGRLWPFFAGERGEYELAAHHVFKAKTQLLAIWRTAIIAIACESG